VLTRSLPTLTASAAVLAVLVAGCHGGGSSVAGVASSSTAPPASVPASASVLASASAPAGSPSTAAAVPTKAAPSSVVYLAEGGSVGGTALRDPACTADCVLSGDSTVALRNMTWQAWNSTVATGKGTEMLNDCTPNCAQGKPYAVPVEVTLSKPVMVCVSGAARWLWTRVSFVWPNGLPAALSGGNAPLNPFDYQDITAQAAKSCP
jgi:hypothetical protein